MSDFRLSLVAVACVAVGAALLAAAGAFDAPGLAVAGSVCVLAAYLAREVQLWRGGGPLWKLVTVFAAGIALVAIVGALLLTD